VSKQLEDEAKEFKRLKDADRQRRHRAGTKTYPVQLDRIVVGKLIRARAISPGASPEAIGVEIANVVTAALNGRLKVVPALPPETRVSGTWPAEDTNRPVVKGKHRRKKDPGRTLVGKEKARVAAQIMAEEERRRIAKEQEARCNAIWADCPALDPVKDYQLRKERIAREEEEKLAAYRAKVVPPQAPKTKVFQPLGKSGISKRGGKPVTNGFGTHPSPKSQADSVAPIRMKIKAADVRKYAKITPADESVHTLPATEAEYHEMYSGTGPETE
jgi:hypothetical protein